MKKYVIEFTMLDGSKQEVEFTTNNIDLLIEQWSRNRPISRHEILKEGAADTKQMLLG